VSFLSKIKAVGRAIDPTSSTAPLGALVRSAINSTDAGKQALATVDAVNKASSKPAPAPAPAPPGSPVAPGLTTKLGISTGLLVAAGLVVLLLVMRRK
jgi:hypothetical protein